MRLHEASGELTITGAGFGTAPVVAVDGQPVTVLPGGTDTQLVVMAPAAALTTPGTYRLSVVDPARRLGDGFVIAITAETVAAVAASGGAGTGGTSSSGTPGDSTSRTSARATVADTAGTRGVSPNLIEDVFNTALGQSALVNVTQVPCPGCGTGNTAIGKEALYFTTGGRSNVALGDRAGYNATSGSHNVFIGAGVLGTPSDTNTIQIGRPYSAGAGIGQNRAFIAGIRGTTVSGGQPVLIDANGQLGSAGSIDRLDLADSTATAGNVTKNGTLFLHNFGVFNTFLGLGSGNVSMTGSANTGSGFRALAANSSGSNNTASGIQALHSNTTADNNTASGRDALFYSTTGGNNTASGYQALLNNTTGASNTGLGYLAGANATTGSHNVFVGADVMGTASDTNTMRLGRPYDSITGAGQAQTFIAGIRGTPVLGGDVVFVDANGQLGSGPTVRGNSIGSAEVVDDSLTASDLAPNAVGTSEVVDDSLTASDLAPNAVGTSELADGAVTAAKVAFSFASLGANTFAGTQQIGTGNLDLGTSTAKTGHVTKNGVRFLHNFGQQNTFLGEDAGNVSMTGDSNTATGTLAIFRNTTGSENTASGFRALQANTAGNRNTAIGAGALLATTTGASNVALGAGAGVGAANGSYNVFVGAEVAGTASDANTIRIGLPYNSGTGAGQNQTFIAGIAGTPLTSPAVPVFIDANGQLGTQPPTAPPGGWASVGAAAGGASTLPPGVQAQLEAQQATIAELQRARVDAAQTIEQMQRLVLAQQAALAALQDRLASLEGVRRRR